MSVLQYVFIVYQYIHLKFIISLREIKYNSLSITRVHN